MAFDINQANEFSTLKKIKVVMVLLEQVQFEQKSLLTSNPQQSPRS